MRKPYEQLLVNLDAPLQHTWKDTLENPGMEDVLDHFLKTFATIAYEKTLTTHRTSTRSIFSSSKDLIQQHIARATTPPVQVSPFSTTSTPASKLFDPFDTASPLQRRAPFTPYYIPPAPKMDRAYGYPATPEDDPEKFFDRILESRSMSILNAEAKLEYLDRQCAEKDAHIADLQGAVSPGGPSDSTPTQLSERDIIDGLQADVVLEKVRHLGQRLAELRHEIDCTELLIELKDMRIAQLQVLKDADAALTMSKETHLAVNGLRVSQIEEQIDRFEEAEVESSGSELGASFVDAAGIALPEARTESSISARDVDCCGSVDS